MRGAWHADASIQLLARWENIMPKGGTADFKNIRVGDTVAGTEGANEVISAQIKDTFKQMYGAIQQGIMPKQMLHIDDSTLESIYAQAYQLYNQGKFKEASCFFVILGLLDPNQAKYQLGSAACLHRLGHYEKAGQVYLMCSALDQKNPLPQFHAADCYIKLSAFPIAELCLKNAIEICGQQKEYELVKERALLMQAAVKEELAEFIRTHPDEPTEEKK
ncbi:MAG: SycD/LcrH family type III secretion system chaperone [Chlamydiales bacterium]|nr:SycD/LcrH family type III secretion system chaperone [Chlamydiales bacterium]